MYIDIYKKIYNLKEINFFKGSINNNTYINNT